MNGPSSSDCAATGVGLGRAATVTLLPPDEELARVQPVAPRHRRDGRRRVEALGHDPGLLLVGPAATPADPGDHLEPAEAVVARTGRTTSVMGCRASSPPSVHLATGVMLPSVVGTGAATPCHQREVGEPIYDMRGSSRTAGPLSYHRLHRPLRPGDGTSPGQDDPPRPEAACLPYPIMPRPPPCRSGTRCRRPTGGAGRSRACGPPPPWPAACPGAWPPPAPSA